MELNNTIVASTQEIANNFLISNIEAIGGQKSFDRLEESISFAWDNWDESIVSTYYEGKKPNHATDKFTIEWIENELGNNPDDWDSVLNA